MNTSSKNQITNNEKQVNISRHLQNAISKAGDSLNTYQNLIEKILRDIDFVQKTLKKNNIQITFSVLVKHAGFYKTQEGFFYQEAYYLAWTKKPYEFQNDYNLMYCLGKKDAYENETGRISEAEGCQPIFLEFMPLNKLNHEILFNVRSYFRRLLEAMMDEISLYNDTYDTGY